MKGKRQSCNSLLNIISRAATAALAIAVVLALTVVLSQSAQAQSPATGGIWTEKVLHSFGNGTDGYWPSAGLIFDAAGNLYGTTQVGGTYNYGTVFELTPQAGGGWTETVLHSFNDNGTDGYYPSASLIFDAVGNLYGTTPAGGTYGGGTLFELTPIGGGNWAETVLYGFCSQANCADGYKPEAGLIFDAAGNLYSTTEAGGTYGEGTVFELSPTAGGGWTEQVLYSFGNGTHGTNPEAGLIFDAAGNLYGTTVNGGTYNYGTAFRLSPGEGGWTETVLHNFGSGTDGAYLYGGLIFDAAGNLYSTTYAGGTYTSCTGTGGCGTVFELTPTGGGGWTETVLYSFCPQDNCTDGFYPEAGVILDAAGNLYGTTSLGGGPHSSGTVFELMPTVGGGWTETVLHSFSIIGADGTNPVAGLIFDTAGNLYGTTYEGGIGRGTVFELTPVYPCVVCSHAVLR